MFIPETLPNEPLTLAQAIARVEGWYAQGQVPNRPQRNNNPGDIEMGFFAMKFGAKNGDPRFAIFPSAQNGWRALNALLKTDSYIDLTVREAISRYAPPNENDVDMYVAAVCNWTKTTPTDTVRAVLELQHTMIIDT